MSSWLEHPTWTLTRAAGLFAYLLLWCATITGLLQSTRVAGKLLPDSLVLTTHRWSATWSLYAAVVHMVILVYDR